MKHTPSSSGDHATYYDGIAAGYNELHCEEQRNKYRIIAHELALPPSALVLDVGAGTGIGNAFFPHAVGIDPSPELLKQHPNPHRNVGGAESLPFPDESFDAVLCVSAIHHTDYKQALTEMLRVTRSVIAVTVLKKSPKAEEISTYIVRALQPYRTIEEAKDLIFLARKA